MEFLRFSEFDITLQEIPNEISLTFTITGCNLRCSGCHSSYLWKDNGEILTHDKFIGYLNKYSNGSCVLFMGGEWKEDLINLLKIAKEYGFKTALYTGLYRNELNDTIIENLDYLKTGRYIKEMGGLDSKNTNQVLINLNTNEILNKYFYI